MLGETSLHPHYFQGSAVGASEVFESPPPFYSMYVYISLNRVKRVYIQTILINHFQTSIQSA